MALADRSDVLPRGNVSERKVGGCAETWEETSGVRRALLTRLLVDGSERTQVVVDRRELGFLFGRRRDDIAWELFAPRLRVCDFLEDAIEYLEGEMAEAEAEPTGKSGRKSYTCWFTTPGVDFDVVFQTLQRARNHHFVGLMFGPWPHGSAVYAFGDAMSLCGFESPRELLRESSTMTEEKAFRALASCRI
ncbi:hypothetical protein [Actinocorallia aurantiaca]|uniref:Uncharacterized protein n=1 Tax=Actinocorallia aurantiaca TaxID=46204 RepID=A0ABN3UGM7_9ACTN